MAAGGSEAAEAPPSAAKLEARDEEQAIPVLGGIDSNDKLGNRRSNLLAVDKRLVELPGPAANDAGGGVVGELGNLDLVKAPHVAKKKSATRGKSEPIDEVAVWRAKRLKSQQRSSATRGQKTLRKNQPHAAKGKPYVEAVKASKGTWAFRLRWYENGRRAKPVYISRVADAVYEMIREGNYESFKEQLIGSHSASAIRAGNRA